MSEDVVRVLSVLRAASMVTTADGTVLRASERALALGLAQRGKITVPAIVSLIGLVAESGEPREQELRVPRPPLMRETLDLRVRVAEIGDGAMLLIIDDLAEERRVEATRRDFVANISHELKTPVGAISLLAEAIDTVSDDPEQVRAFAQRMQGESVRLASLIQDVIDLSRLQGDDPLTHAEVLEAADLVRAVTEEVATVAQASGIVIITSELPALPLYGDRRQLHAALRNLLVNAINYSPAGTNVAVSVRQQGPLAEIAVKDQGPGIPPSDLERVFERFYRVDPARSRASGGTGLGLAIVKHVCQNHGGECTLWSEVGVGSTFTLRLPVYAGEESELIPVLEVRP